MAREDSGERQRLGLKDEQEEGISSERWGPDKGETGEGFAVTQRMGSGCMFLSCECVRVTLLGEATQQMYRILEKTPGSKKGRQVLTRRRKRLI